MPLIPDWDGKAPLLLAAHKTVVTQQEECTRVLENQYVGSVTYGVKGSFHRS